MITFVAWDWFLDELQDWIIERADNVGLPCLCRMCIGEYIGL